MRHINRTELLINLISVYFGIWFGTAATIWLFQRLFPIICGHCWFESAVISRNRRGDTMCWRCKRPLVYGLEM
jgi:hypothetical protein